MTRSGLIHENGPVCEYVCVCVCVRAPEPPATTEDRPSNRL